VIATSSSARHLARAGVDAGIDYTSHDVVARVRGLTGGRDVAWAMPGGAPAALVERHLVVDIAGDLKTYRRED
jgi:NADPH:quinone reductase-like Zn-dependent oxidoreductase